MRAGIISQIAFALLAVSVGAGEAAAAPAAAGTAAMADTSLPAYVRDALTAAGRPPWEFRTDADRKPGSIMSFSGIKPGDAVGEIVPGYGYYTRILSKVVGNNGNVYAIVHGAGGGGLRGLRQAQREGKAPAVVPKDLAEACVKGCYDSGMASYLIPIDYILAIQNIWDYRNVTTLGEGLNQYGGEVGFPEQLDAIFSNGIHELYAPDAKLNMKKITASILSSLKPGGVFVVVDDKQMVSEETVKADALAAGFTADGESNALAGSFVLKFRKPANMTGDKRPPKSVIESFYNNTQVVSLGSPGGGATAGPRERREFYSADGTYQEFGYVGKGPAPMQAGRWFWDAAGHNCQLHEYPLDERGNVVCHDYIQTHKVGDQWKGEGNNDNPHTLLKGHVPM